MAVLTKSSILNGIDKPQKIMIESLGGELWLRPLSSAEVDEIVNIEAKGYGKFEATNTNRTKGKRLQRGESISKGQMDVSKMNEAEAKAKYTAIYMSLDNPKNEDDPWEYGEITKLPPKVTKEIKMKVDEISGVEVSEEDIEDFPEDE